MKIDLPKKYDHHNIEDKWYRYWEERGYFKAQQDGEGEPFSIVIPPPNITGSLHMGHALNNTLQDILARFKRMQGFNTLWLPGTDHAGIATQNVVEKELSKEGIVRDDLGRDEFVKRVWTWKEEYGSRIIMQLKRLGASCDWSRERFTMDPGLSRVVREVFVRLYEDGYIYRGNYIINWCPRCHTALSDIEVEHKTINGHLYYIKYPVKPTANSQQPTAISVATTRPETMLGDTAVAANPEDERFKALIGQTAILPILNREIPIIEDGFVDPEFGTGLVKVTPAHDPNDFEIGRRHNLAEINILNQDATVNENAGPYAGLDRYECRSRLLADLEREGYLEKVEDYVHSVGHCYRCQTVVEPYLSRQWFVSMKELAKPAIEAVRTQKVRFVPKSWERTYFEWMENIKDWCISRQIWWGHRIPAWYCKEMQNAKCKMQNGIIVSRVPPASCPYCGAEKLIQDEDVLDTWFSSALWPFSTMGWPDQVRDLKTFYPTSVLSTGFDIIYFWVARMIIMGLKFMGEVPFREVYIHALIRDAEGQKMSKSRGNIIDPLVVIDQYGADALRFTLSILAVQGRDIVLSEERISGYHHFCNKLWNAARFIMMNLDGYNPSRQPTADSQQLCDRWITSRLSQITASVTTSLETYSFNQAAQTLYDFIWHEYCDWYIELAKLRLYADDESDKRDTQEHLVLTFETILRLLHPFMPFISEELWGHLPLNKEKSSLMISNWPQSSESLIDEETARKMELIKDIVYNIRNIRGEMGIGPDKRPRTLIRCPDQEGALLLEAHTDYIVSLARLSSLEVGPSITKPPSSATAVVQNLEVYLPLEGMIDIDRERERLRKELTKVEEELERVRSKLSNGDFISKAKPEVIEREKTRKDDLSKRHSRLSENIRGLGVG